MLCTVLLIVGVGLLVSCAVWRPVRAWVWWAVLCVGICTLFAGCALWQLDATHYGLDVFAKWGGRAVLALALVFAAALYSGKRIRKRDGRPAWGWMRSTAAMLALCTALAGAWITASSSWILRDGWWAAVPSTVLIVGIDQLPDAAEQQLLSRPRHHPHLPVDATRDPMWSWQLKMLKSRLYGRIGSEPTVEAIDAASHMADEFDDEIAARRMCDLAFRALVSGDEELQLRAAGIVRWEVLWYKTRWMHLGGPYLEQHGDLLLPGLIRTLESPRGEVRLAALRAIERMGTRAFEAIPAVIWAMGREPVGWDQHCYWDALDSIGADLSPIRAQQLAALRSPSREVRLDALTRACWCSYREAESAGLFEAVLERLREGDVEEARVAAKAAMHLSAYDHGLQKPLLMDLLLSEAQRRGDNAAMLGEVGEWLVREFPLDSLEKLFAHDYAPLRMAAVQAMRQRLRLSDSGRLFAERTLAEVATSDPDPEIRAAAAERSQWVEIKHYELKAD